MVFRYANGFRPKGTGRDLLKETLAEIKEADLRNRKPPCYYNRAEKKEYFRQCNKTDFLIYAELLGVSFLAAKRKARKQAAYLANFQEYDL